jgi:predicted amidophosphoribosyltransferase
VITILGPWKQGFSFDIHTISSKCIGEDQYGRLQFDNKRSAMGQCLYKLKYGQDPSMISSIVDLLIQNTEFDAFIKSVDAILPTPPSNKYRRLQPVVLVSQEIARRCGKTLRLDVLSSINNEEIKNIDTAEKYSKIKESMHIDTLLDKTEKILIFDDVFDSGSTLTAITDTLMEAGYKDVSVFTLTKTRISN